MLTQWVKIETVEDITIYFKKEKFNGHPDSPWLHHYLYEKLNGWHNNYVCFENFENAKEQFLVRFILEEEFKKNWWANIRKMEAEGIVK